jgi:hypothetical protein
MEWVLQYWSFVDISGYFDTDPLWTWVKNDDWFDPSFASMLTRVKMIETCVESAFTTICVQSAIAGCFLLFWWGRLGRVALHQVTWWKKLNNKLKVVILSLFETKFESESFMVPFYGNSLNSACWCIKTAVTAVVVAENVRMSRRWKAELVVYGICKQPSPRFVHLLPLKPDCSLVCLVCPESFQHLILTSKSHSYQTMHWNKPYEWPDEIWVC